jgi:hypothetical protein
MSPSAAKHAYFQYFRTVSVRTARDCSQMCDYKYLKDQQRSTASKCNLLILREINMYSKDNALDPEPDFTSY